MTMNLEQWELDDYAQRSLRDVADQDYVAARMCHRHGLHLQFLWLAHQSIEKYLKAILLYNRVDSRRMNHDLPKSLEAVLAIEDVPIDLPQDVVEFIDYLNEEGPNRYFGFPYVVWGNSLPRLDRAVWVIRRYCRQLRSWEGSESERKQHLKEQVASIPQIEPIGSVTRYSLWSGELERILEDKESRARSQLIWKNYYYRSRPGTPIRNFPLSTSFGNPSHYLRPGCFAELSKLVYFPRGVKEYLESLSDKA